MPTTIIWDRGSDRLRAIEKIRADLVRCQVRADAMNLGLVAVQLQQALDELEMVAISDEIAAKSSGGDM